MYHSMGFSVTSGIWRYIIPNGGVGSFLVILSCTYDMHRRPVIEWGKIGECSGESLVLRRSPRRRVGARKDYVMCTVLPATFISLPTKLYQIPHPDNFIETSLGQRE